MNSSSSSSSQGLVNEISDAAASGDGVSSQKETKTQKETREERVSRAKDELDDKLEINEHAKHIQRMSDHRTAKARYDHQLDEQCLKMDLEMKVREYQSENDEIQRERLYNQKFDVGHKELELKHGLDMIGTEIEARYRREKFEDLRDRVRAEAAHKLFTNDIARLHEENELSAINELAGKKMRKKVELELEEKQYRHGVADTHRWIEESEAEEDMKSDQRLKKAKGEYKASLDEKDCVSDHVETIRWRSELYSKWFHNTSLLFLVLMALPVLVAIDRDWNPLSLFAALNVSAVLFLFFLASLLARTKFSGIDWVVTIEEPIYGVEEERDIRPESMSSVDIKYRFPSIRKHSRELYVVIWNTRIFRIWGWRGYHSTELLHHLSANNLQYVHADEDTAKKKRALMIENFHNLNLPRNLMMRFGNLGRQTAFLSHGMWCADRQASDQMDF